MRLNWKDLGMIKAVALLLEKFDFITQGDKVDMRIELLRRRNEEYGNKLLIHE